ncbi:TRAP transporter small permease [Litoribacter alkaliphilus]|uniref:TRAP transporter small permease n=1 Tax=Litoribacter ruber TaxID=702568 RepID=A0AAP2G0R8_9BACT|nr:TRAP transporter small permease [Litoribacter alkaliphilus]MBS9522787.1 TRAP transporter small permease [Litoribacter alkaliphilus]
MFSPKIVAILDKWLARTLVLLMSLMVLNVTWQVMSRYIFQNPSAFTDELSRYMLIWLGMLGAAYVAGQNKHLAIDILPQSLKGKQKIYLQVIINFFILVFAIAVMIGGGANLVYITFVLEQKSATLQLPLALIYSMIPFSGLLVVYYQLAQITSSLHTLKKRT